MSTLLYRIGKNAYGHPWRVIGVWLVLLAVIVTALSAGTIRVSSEIRIDGTPAQQVLDELAARLPAASGGQESIVFQAPQGDRIDSTENATAIAAAVSQIYSIDRVIDPRALAAAQNSSASSPSTSAAPTSGAVTARTAAGTGTVAEVGPLVAGGQPVPGVVVSADGRVAMLQVQFTDQIFELPTGTVDKVVSAAKHTAQGTGITVLSGATLGIPEILGVGEIVGVEVALLHQGLL